MEIMIKQKRQQQMKINNSSCITQEQYIYKYLFRKLPLYNGGNLYRGSRSCGEKYTIWNNVKGVGMIRAEIGLKNRQIINETYSFRCFLIL
jgi:hypothetical protein